MKKVIYLHRKSERHPKLFFIKGGFWVLIGLSHVFFDWPFWIVIAQIIVFLLSGFYYLYYGGRLIKIPRMEIDKEKIWLKNDIFTQPIEVSWDAIREISYGSYLIEFQLNNGEKEFVRLNTDYPDTSIAIKNCIMEIADEKDIHINSG